MEEVWKPVVGYEGLYEVSDLGRVRGLDRRIGNSRPSRTRIWRGRILKQTVMSNGYYEVSLCIDGIRTVRTVHSLVCEAFRGGGYGLEVAHADGNRLNCRADNLSWKTRTENHADKKRHGTHLQGSKIIGSKAVETDIERMRDLRAAGNTHQRIADWLGFSRKLVSRALAGETWRHV